MGRALRGSLWLLFPPAGWIASRRATRRADVARQERTIELLEQRLPTTPATSSDGRRELIEQLTATANNPAASDRARRIAAEKLAQLGQ